MSCVLKNGEMWTKICTQDEPYVKINLETRVLFLQATEFLKIVNKPPETEKGMKQTFQRVKRNQPCGWLIGKDSDAGRDWGKEQKGTTEDEMAGWHHWLDGRESQWTPGVGDEQGGLVCWDSWGRKESGRTEQMIWSYLKTILHCKLRKL